MRIKEDYFMTAQIEYLFEMTESIYKKVFRYDLSEPGFVVIDLGTSLTSEKLRACMVMLKNNLNQMHTMKVGV